MKKNNKTKSLVFVSFVSFVVSIQAATTIDPASPYGYGANIGWINAEADGAHGAVIGQAFCSGYLYSANCGWISLGDGAPANGYAYANDSAGDFGVNHDGLGNLTGYAYGANIGWINFEQTYGHPRVDLMTGELSGYAWGANVGWIALADIKTLTLAAGSDTDSDGIPDAWEMAQVGNLTTLGNGDADGDGVADPSEYLADTDPTDELEFLVITGFQALEGTNTVTWPVQTTRLYTLEYATALSNGTSWVATGASFIPPSGPDVTETVPTLGDSARFYRVKATPPLSQ